LLPDGGPPGDEGGLKSGLPPSFRTSLQQRGSLDTSYLKIG
jgi:hypothetical protein